MILYHGTNQPFDTIDLSRSKSFKDFGKAFYLSADESQALDIAAAKTLLLGGTETVIQFEFDVNILHSDALDVKIFPTYNQEWANFVFDNRNDAISFRHPFDIVYGPIANDRIGLQIDKYRKEDITFETFLEKIKFAKGPTFQYAFCTQQAIEKLHMR